MYYVNRKMDDCCGDVSFVSAIALWLHRCRLLSEEFEVAVFINRSV